MLPPGDLRNCMVALSEDEHLISRLFQHRFRSGEGLEGHSFGNLFVAALSEITGDFAQAIKLSSQVLATRGHIYPVTNANVSLAARMRDGSIVRGETSITASRKHIVELMLEPAEVLFWHNWTNFHSRTAFEDAPGQRRLLLRLWLNIENGRAVAPEIAERARLIDRDHEERRAA